MTILNIYGIYISNFESSDQRLIPQTTPVIHSIYYSL